MAQGNDKHAPPATSSDSMSSVKGDTGFKGSSSRLVLGGAMDKGKGLPKIEEGEGGRSKGKTMRAPVVAARRDGRSRGRRGDRELHIITERERRRRMSEMFIKLHGLLPTLPDKVDKSSIVMEAIHYIKSLEGTLSELERHKMERDLAQGKPVAAVNGGVACSAMAAAPVTMATTATGLLAGGIWQTGAVPAPSMDLGAVIAATEPVALQTWSGPNVVLSLSGNYAYIHMSVARRPGVLTMVMAVLEKHGIDVVTSGISSDHSQRMFTIQARINGVSNPFGDNVASDEIYKLAVSEIMVWLSE